METLAPMERQKAALRRVKDKHRKRRKQKHRKTNERSRRRNRNATGDIASRASRDLCCVQAACFMTRPERAESKVHARERPRGRPRGRPRQTQGSSVCPRPLKVSPTSLRQFASLGPRRLQTVTRLLFFFTRLSVSAYGHNRKKNTHTRFYCFPHRQLPLHSFIHLSILGLCTGRVTDTIHMKMMLRPPWHNTALNT